jgi:hypothetical protein
LEQICSSARAENQAAARRLNDIGELWLIRLRECGEREDWVVDAAEAVAAEVAAALGVSQGLASTHLRYARAMRERLPELAKVFLAGDLDFRLFQTIVYRTDLITDDDVLAAVDAQLAVAAPRWPSMTPGRLAGKIDKIVFAADRDAIRRSRERQSDRDVWIGDCIGGVSEIHGSLFTPDAHALDKRLNALAAARSAYQGPAPCRRTWRVGGRSGSVGLPLRACRLLRRGQGCRSGGDPCDR